jgi:predicted DNA-binding protein
MSIQTQEIKTRFSYALPAWLKEKLAQLSQETGKDVNDLITEALTKTYPELRNKSGSVLAHFIGPKQ